MESDRDMLAFVTAIANTTDMRLHANHADVVSQARKLVKAQGGELLEIRCAPPLESTVLFAAGSASRRPEGVWCKGNYVEPAYNAENDTWEWTKDVLAYFADTTRILEKRIVVAWVRAGYGFSLNSNPNETVAAHYVHELTRTLPSKSVAFLDSQETASLLVTQACQKAAHVCSGLRLSTKMGDMSEKYRKHLDQCLGAEYIAHMTRTFFAPVRASSETNHAAQASTVN